VTDDSKDEQPDMYQFLITADEMRVLDRILQRARRSVVRREDCRPTSKKRRLAKKREEHAQKTPPVLQPPDSDQADRGPFDRAPPIDRSPERSIKARRPRKGYPCPESLVGRVVGALKVTALHVRGKNSPLWTCVCLVCNAEQVWRGATLRNGRPRCRSCGARTAPPPMAYVAS